MPPKTLGILGDANAGKATLTGQLLFTCGATLPVIEFIERSQVRDYRGIASLFRQQGRPISFYGPSSQYTVTEPAGHVQVALWVVDASADDQGLSSSQRLEALLSAGELRVEEHLIVIANKMELSDWSEDNFSSIVRSFSKIKSAPSSRISIVPLCGLRGDNLIEGSDKAARLQTVAAAGEQGISIVAAQPLMSLL
ncbi:ADP-ribosylation factor-like protein [Microdochium nivale]|nr:ADP-ribosylation factor-like protein [Microdochium nivale]